MNDDDDYPQFGNAFPAVDASNAAQTASWNPALRPDSERGDEDDDFFDRYPGATPKKNQSASAFGKSLEAPDDEDYAVRRPSISVESIVDVRHDDAEHGDLDRVPSYAAGAEGPATYTPQEMYHDEDDEEQVLRPDETAEQQRHGIDERIPDARESEATQHTDAAVEQVDHASAHVEGDVARPEEHYEHQGEATAMDEAIDPSGDAPLLEDEEPLPTTGQISREPTFDAEQAETALGFDGAPAPSQPAAKSQPARAQIDRSFTSNFVAPSADPEPAPPQFAQSAPDDWPSFSDDQTFGELLDKENASKGDQKAPQQETVKAMADDSVDDLLPEDEGEIPEADLAAAWGAALDDDDMLADTPTDFDPSNAFGGDDEDGFLEDELTTPIQQQPTQGVPQQPQSQQRSVPTNQYRPANAQTAAQQPRIGMPAPQPFDNLSRSVGTPQTGLPDFYNQQQEQAPQRPSISQTQSFVDKAKGGYQSPYDLPMEVVKPRRRPQTQQQPPQQPAPAPPPRTSSFNAQSHPPPPSAGSGASMSPPSSSHGPGSVRPPAEGGSSAKTTPKTGSGFFEDLPVAAKPRARPAGQYTPGPGVQGMPTPPPGPMQPPQQHPSRQQAQPMAPPQRPAAPPTPSQQPQAMYGGLQHPDRMPLLPDQPPQPEQAPAQQGPPPSARYSPSNQSRDISAAAPPPAVTGRYSPAPAATQGPAGTRYSPAPAVEPGQKSRQSSSAGPPPGPMFRQPSHAFAPRTSSPLAGFTDKPHPPLPSEAPKPLPSSPPQVNGIQTTGFVPQESKSVSMYSPQEMRAADPQLMPPPPRPRTQSPDNTRKTQKASHARRPSSAGKMANIPSIPPAARPKGPVLPHRRQFSRDLTIVRPDNETAQDPLERWKGHPVFHWSASGTALSSFPRQTPFYAAGQGVPSLKCTPGEIKIQDVSTFIPMDDRNAKFPGPLPARSKGKKKDLLTWMTAKIEDLERATEGAMLDFNLENEAKKRVEEKLVLWKIMRVFLDHDGVLEGNPKIDDELRRILMPNLAQMGQVMDLHTPASATAATAGEPVDKHVLLQLRLALFEGQRERAVWLAEEKKLWGHAMLIASTMGPDMWKQIVAAFVRNQIKSLGSDARSMAAAYQIFAGNADECVDELVPPSARAGFTMVAANKEELPPPGHSRGRSKSYYERNPLDGLDAWRETLSLITSNRTPTDGPSLITLGKLLSSYGRVEAAHACFLFARQFVKHSGPDDAEAHFVLLSANHAPTSQDIGFGSDLDSILLTEIFEFASSLSAPSASVAYIPHLQAFKLLHAQELASRGLKIKAQTYCDHITSVYTSTTRPSPYYHPQFTQAVSDLQALLSQTPADGKKGLFSKTAMSKVSSSTSSWFSKFVAGEEDQPPAAPDAASDQAGPFGMVGASPPSISRPGSAAGMYNPMMGGAVGGGVCIGSPLSSPPLQQGFMPNAAAPVAASRYAPGAAVGTKHAPAQPYSGLGVPAAEPQRPGSARYAPAPSNLGVPGISRASSDYGPAGSRRGSAQDTSSQGSYEPKPLYGADEGSNYSYSPPILSRPELAAPTRQDSFPDPNGLPPPAHQPPQTSGSDEMAPPDPESGSGYAPPNMQSSGYEPPSYSYQPYEPEPDSPVDEKPKPKRRTYGDEDEDDPGFAAHASALKKSQADREADDAFRKAAEADAARDAANKSGDGKKGWFGGWFGGKGKDPNAPPGSGPIKAKLGEENSFYFDKDLGKWVNKKAGADAATPAAATPPPPRGPASRVTSMGPPTSGPPSRASSGVGLSGLPGGGPAAGRPPTSGSLAFSGPPSGPPSRVGTPASVQSSNPDIPHSHPPPGLSGSVPPLPLNGLEGAGSGPPSRPSTSLSNASSIDDLLAGGGGPRKGGSGGTVKGKKKGRYVDVMAK